MAKLTRSQAKYIEDKFEKEMYAQGKRLEKAYEKEWQAKSNKLFAEFKKKYKEWANVTHVIREMVSHVLFKEGDSSSQWTYINTKMKIFNTESRKLQEELHESLLFCDGSLETAQQIINNFTNKLKEIK